MTHVDLIEKLLRYDHHPKAAVSGHPKCVFSYNPAERDRAKQQMQ